MLPVYIVATRNSVSFNGICVCVLRLIAQLMAAEKKPTFCLPFRLLSLSLPLTLWPDKDEKCLVLFSITGQIRSFLGRKKKFSKIVKAIKKVLVCGKALAFPRSRLSLSKATHYYAESIKLNAQLITGQFSGS